MFTKDQALKMMTNLREKVTRRIAQEAKTSVSERFLSTVMDAEKLRLALILLGYKHLTFVNLQHLLRLQSKKCLGLWP